MAIGNALYFAVRIDRRLDGVAKSATRAFEEERLNRLALPSPQMPRPGRATARPGRTTLDLAALVVATLKIAGCAASAPPLTHPSAGASARPPLVVCDVLNGEANEKVELLTRCRERLPVWQHQVEFDRLDASVGQRLATVRTGLEPQTHPHEAQAIAEQIWSLLDALAAERAAGLDANIVQRVEDATENLIRQTTGEERTQALAPLASALGALRAAIEPAPDATDACSDEEQNAITARLRADAACIGAEFESERGAFDDSEAPGPNSDAPSRVSPNSDTPGLNPGAPGASSDDPRPNQNGG